MSLDDGSLALFSRECCCLGDLAPLSEGKSEGGVSCCGVPTLLAAAPGGSDGSAFSTDGADPCPVLGAGRDDEPPFAFFRRRAIRLSWQLMQKMPCEVRA